MYLVTQLLDRKWACSVRIQDGTERWNEDTREKAVQSVISAARVLNGSYITESDIEFAVQQPLPPRTVSEEDWTLLQDIKRGAKVVLDHSDRKIRYRLTDEDCETIIKIREGDLVLVSK